MEPPKVYVTRKLPGVALKMLHPHFRVVANFSPEPLSRDLLKIIVMDYDGILSTVADKLDASMLSNAGSLEAISNYASGLDNIDVSFARQNGISVYNTPDAVTDSCADYTFALLLTLIRNTAQADNFVRAGKWKGWDPELLLGEELSGKTFGIIGCGRVGKAVAKRANGFGMNVIAYSPSPVKCDGVTYVGLDELLAKSDYLSLHCRLNDSSKGMIGHKEFAMMEKKPILINMARGPVVQTDALVYALKNGQVRGAALDVFDPEPILPGHPLLSFQNCIVSPHVGTATKECREKMAIKAAQNLIDHFEGVR